MLGCLKELFLLNFAKLTNWKHFILKNHFYLACLLFLTACSNNTKDIPEAPLALEDKRKLNFGSLTGGSGIVLSSQTISGRTRSETVSIKNPYLWQASLDTLHFAPLVSTDGPGGVIISDWYKAKGSADQLKIQIRIVSNELRANALQVDVYRKVKRFGQWENKGLDKEAAASLEEIILHQARKIRVRSNNKP